MKTSLRFLSAILAVGFFGTAQAQIVTTGKINFTGNIRHVTCSLTSDSVNQTIAFGYVSPAAFGTPTVVGSTVGEKPFAIKIEGCTLGAVPGGSGAQYPTQALVRFYGSNVNTTSGNLNLTGPGTPASGVQIRLKNSSRVAMALQNATAQAQSSTVITLLGSPSVNTLDFFAEYIATSATVTGGGAGSTVDFEMVYP